MTDYQKERLQPQYLVDTNAAFAEDFLIGTAATADTRLNCELVKGPKGGLVGSPFCFSTPRQLVTEDPVRFRYLNVHEYMASMEAMKEWESTR